VTSANRDFNVARLAPGVVAECVDARAAVTVERLAPWCVAGQTVALVGSSGVGKSTLVNTLTGARQAVSPIRAADQRGRHATTARSMHRLAQGGWLLDTPGMRELKLVDAASALDDVFTEIGALAAQFRFADCGQRTEPRGAAISFPHSDYGRGIYPTRSPRNVPIQISSPTASAVLAPWSAAF